MIGPNAGASMFAVLFGMGGALCVRRAGTAIVVLAQNILGKAPTNVLESPVDSLSGVEKVWAGYVRVNPDIFVLVKKVFVSSHYEQLKKATPAVLVATAVVSGGLACITLFIAKKLWKGASPEGEEPPSSINRFAGALASVAMAVTPLMTGGATFFARIRSLVW